MRPLHQPKTNWDSPPTSQEAPLQATLSSPTVGTAGEHLKVRFTPLPPHYKHFPAPGTPRPTTFPELLPCPLELPLSPLPPLELPLCPPPFPPPDFMAPLRLLVLSWGSKQGQNLPAAATEPHLLSGLSSLSQGASREGEPTCSCGHCYSLVWSHLKEQPRLSGRWVPLPCFLHQDTARSCR